MKIKTFNIKYFKFYKDLSLDAIDGKNILLYGENGSGKSSLYCALEKVLYAYFKSTLSLESIEKSENKNFPTEKIAIFLELNNGKKLAIKHNGSHYNSAISMDGSSHHSLYFLNTRTLNSINENKNLFDVFKILRMQFAILEKIYRYANEIEEKVKTLNIRDDESIRDEIIEKRQSLDRYMGILVTRLLENTGIISECFKDDINIRFDLEDSVLEHGGRTWKFTMPKLFIIIDGEREYSGVFHEAKLKILSLIVFFSLVSIDENTKDNEIDRVKLLVMDDFLSSLDMGNRLYVMKYIFEEFKDFQKIVMTHNLMLFNVVKRLISDFNESSEWQYKNIFFNNNEPSIHDQKYDYFDDAQIAYNQNDFEYCGNLLRKELEKIVSQIEIRLVTGKKRELDEMMKTISKQDTYVLDAQKCVLDIVKNLENLKDTILLNGHLNNEQKITKMQSRLSKIDKMEKLDFKLLNPILNDLMFHKNLILNKAAHMSDEDIYRKEYEQALLEVKDLRAEFNKLSF